MSHLKLTLIILLTTLFTSIHSFAGLEENKSLIPRKTEIAYLGGGCFWGLQDLIRKQPGIKYTEVGYMGDQRDKANYELVHTGKTEFAETVKIEFDPKIMSYEKLIYYFFKIHDPTTMNQQGNDKGRQYRSVIFYTSDTQHTVAKKVIEKINKMKAWKNPIVTEVTTALKWIKAEDYHQDYLVKNPAGYTCHFERKLNF